MNAVPAKVAGVARVVMVVPSPDGKLNPLVLAAAHLGGVSEIYRVGGAQAVAALAYGTATIAPVAKIVGPGNAYVAAAKRLVFGKVGIDMIAGPSEVLVIADDTGNAGWIAADLLAQAEHDANAQSILITDSARACRRGRARGGGAARDAAARRNRARLVERFRRHHPGEEARRGGAAGERDRRRASGDHDRGSGSARRANPQCRRDLPRAPHARRRSATMSAAPTTCCRRRARRGSRPGLGVLDFMKRTSILKCGPDQLRALGPAAMTLGKAEGLDAHARSVGLRLNLP